MAESYPISLTQRRAHSVCSSQDIGLLELLSVDIYPYPLASEDLKESP